MGNVLTWCEGNEMNDNYSIWMKVETKGETFIDLALVRPYLLSERRVNFMPNQPYLT